MSDNNINGNEILAQLDEIHNTGIELINNANNQESITDITNKYLGRKGKIADIMKTLGRLSKEDRPKVGQKANEVRGILQNLINQKKENLSTSVKTGPDLTLPGKRFAYAGDHPYHATLREIVDIFVSMGFEIADGPDIDTVYNNFDALNTPIDHPSRSEEDTFYLNEENLLLRTQTSPVQIRVMKSQEPPVKIVAPGRCYRRDTVDATHYFSFSQVEGLYIDKNVTLSDLKGVLTNFAKRILGDDAAIRFRSHFFPFTEPSVEYDFTCVCGGDPKCRICKGTGWIEISGAGMVDPNVLKAVGYDPEVWSGYAFGMGVERIALVKHDIRDIRLLYENDKRMLSQF